MTYKFNNSDAIGLLLDAGFDVNAVDNSEETPLMVAISRNNFSKVKFLIDHGADVTHVGRKGNPLHVAVNEPTSIGKKSQKKRKLTNNFNGT